MVLDGCDGVEAHASRRRAWRPRLSFTRRSRRKQKMTSVVVLVVVVLALVVAEGEDCIGDVVVGG